MAQFSSPLLATWNFPQVKPSEQSKVVADEIDFVSYYQSPEDFRVSESDSRRMKAEKLARREGQIIRRAMGAVRDWVSQQAPWIAHEALQGYDFDWTAPELAAEDQKWAEDDDDD
jgi:hypothetical protein